MNSVSWKDLYHFLDLKNTSYQNFFGEVVHTFCQAVSEKNSRAVVTVPSCGSSGSTYICSLALQDLKKGLESQGKSFSSITLSQEEEKKYGKIDQIRFIFKYARWEQNRSAKNCSDFLRFQGFEAPDIAFGRLEDATIFSKIAAAKKKQFSFDPQFQTFIGMIAFEGATLESLIKGGETEFQKKESLNKIFYWFGRVVFQDLLLLNTDRLFRVEKFLSDYNVKSAPPNSGNVFIRLEDKGFFKGGALIDNEHATDLFKSRSFLTEDVDLNLSLFEQEESVITSSLPLPPVEEGRKNGDEERFQMIFKRFKGYLLDPDLLLKTSFNSVVHDMKIQDHSDQESFYKEFKQGFVDEKGAFVKNKNHAWDLCFKNEKNSFDPQEDYFSPMIRNYIKECKEMILKSESINEDVDLGWFYLSVKKALDSREVDRFSEIEELSRNIFKEKGLQSSRLEKLIEAYKQKDISQIQLNRFLVSELIENKKYDLFWEAEEVSNKTPSASPEKNKNKKNKG
jgi:hypothetical protein